MKVAADDRTPLSSIVNAVETDDGYAFELESPLLLNGGARLSFEMGVWLWSGWQEIVQPPMEHGPRDAIDTGSSDG